MKKQDTVRVAAVQISPDLESLSGTLKKVLNVLDEAAEKQVGLIVFPETFMPYYPYFSFILPPVKQLKYPVLSPKRCHKKHESTIW